MKRQTYKCDELQIENSKLQKAFDGLKKKKQNHQIINASSSEDELKGTHTRVQECKNPREKKIIKQFKICSK